MPDDSPILPTPRLKQAAKGCPLLEGDREAWIACCSRRFFSLARRITDEDPLAEDALQESWMSILKTVDAYRGGSPACSWVGAIVANKAKDICKARSKVRKREVPLPESEIQTPTPALDVPAQAERLRWLREVVGLLPEIYRQVLELRYGQGLSPEEAAEQLHISRTSVNTRLNRAVALVRRCLEARLRQESSSPMRASHRTR